MRFEKEYTSFDAAGFSKIFKAYISGDAGLRNLYNHSPESSSFVDAIEALKQMPINRELLVDVLTEQYNLPSFKGDKAKYDKSILAIKSLGQEQTFTVCTGHQLCLFTGPLYFIYKIASTIKLSIELKNKYPQYNFVPVYWMATEDHDFEEINHAHVFGKKVEWNREEAIGSFNPPAGKIKTSSLGNILTQVNEMLGSSEQSGYLRAIFDKAYAQHDNLADATRYLVHELFALYGLIIVDANDRRLKNIFAPIVKDELLNFSSFALVNNEIKHIEENGFNTQVKPREINLFYLTENSRERIIAEDGVYKVLNTDLVFTEKEILKELENNSAVFSPNVILRPVYQQLLLPNLAYVGGPAEIAYWLQLKSVFDHHRVFFPILLPRNFVLFVEEKSAQLLAKLSLTNEDVFLPIEALVKKAVTNNTAAEISLGDIEEPLKELYLQIGERAVKVDKTLQAMVEAELQKNLKSLSAIEAKMLRAEKQKQEITVNQVSKLKEKLFPSGVLQERYDNFIPYYLKYGEGFIKTLLDTFDPFDYRVLVIKENSSTA